MENSGFDLTKAGRRNLEAVCFEFERCARFYPPLYHQRLKPWSEECEIPITMQEWEAFKRVESERNNGDSWSQWDGPYSYLGGSESAHEFGMWLGNADGLNEFLKLSESLELVMRNEDIFANEFPHSLSREQWPYLLHEWAFRYQMPLLRSDMTLWGHEECSEDEFYGIAEQWSFCEAAGHRYPKHPIVWLLIDNVFTSSMTALRAILEPESAITSNESWATLGQRDWDESVAELPIAAADNASSCDDSESTCHRLLFNGLHWLIVEAGGNKLSPLRQSSGMKRIALLLSNPGYRFRPIELQKTGNRKVLKYGITAESSPTESIEDASDSLAHRTSIDMNQEVTDIEACKDLRNQIERLSEEYSEAVRNEDSELLQPIEDKIKELKRQLVFDNDKNGKIRIFYMPAWEKSRKTVGNTIRTALDDIREISSTLADEIDSQIKREDGFTFDPNPKCAKCVVRLPEN